LKRNHFWGYTNKERLNTTEAAIIPWVLIVDARSVWSAGALYCHLSIDYFMTAECLLLGRCSVTFCGSLANFGSMWERAFATRNRTDRWVIKARNLSCSGNAVIALQTLRICPCTCRHCVPWLWRVDSSKRSAQELNRPVSSRGIWTGIACST
jgi:hypothetical protein